VTITQQVHSYDIAVIGGGMVGISMALLLAKALPQRRLVLLDARPFADADELPSQPSFDRRSTALSPTSAELFDRLGVWEALEPEACPIKHIHVSDRGQFGTTRFGPDDNNGEPLGYVVPNLAIGQSLLRQAQQADITVLAPVDVQALKPVRGGMQIQLADQPSLQAELAVLADGAGSPLAANLGVGCHTNDYGQCAIIANVAFESPHQYRAFERFTQQGPLALLPLAGNHQRESGLVWTQPLSRLHEIETWSDAEFLHHLQEAFGMRLGRFTKVGKRSVYPLSLQLAEEQVRSSLVLMGNAAHSLHPVAGQGFNLALRAAARLTRVLADGVAAGESLGSLALLQEYEQIQKRDQDITVSLSDSFIRIFSSAQPAVVAGRNLGLVSLELFGGWRDMFLSTMAGRAQPRARIT
jgi:2-octaprenyl-6-methoxyphenol hydroxylase